MAQTELITVPNFTFKQGTHKDNDFEENPIRVEFYLNGICLRQEGEFDIDESIMISAKHLDTLFKEIKKQYKEAMIHLNNIAAH